MSISSATAQVPWISDLKLPERRTIIVAIAVIAAIVLIGLVVLQLRPSVPDLPPEQARSLGLRMAEAARSRNDTEVLRLLKQGADPDQPSVDGTPAIVWAAHYSSDKTLRHLIRYGANVNGASRLGITALHEASARGDADAASFLLGAEADPDQRDSHGLTALMKASQQGSSNTVEALIDYDADVNAKEPAHGVTALMLAGWYAHGDVARDLIDAGADVKAATKVGPTPKLIPPGFGGGSHGDGIVRGGLPPQGQRAPIPGGMTALLYAARGGNLEAVKAIVGAGADIERPEANGVRPLVMATLNDRIDVATYLVSKGADVNAADWYGRTPLWTAVDLRNLDLAADATDNGVDRPAALKLIKLLLDKGAKPNTRQQNYAPVRAYLTEGGSLSWVDFTGQTAFIRAALSGDVETMTMLLKYGADPNIATYRGTTALMAAAGVNWVYYHTYDEGEDQLLNAVKLCVKLGQDVNATNSMQVTALHGAANRGSNKIINYLVGRGAKLDFADDQGRTALSWAKGVFLATLPAEEKPDTMAVIQRLCDERGLQCEGRAKAPVDKPQAAAAPPPA